MPWHRSFRFELWHDVPMRHEFSRLMWSGRSRCVAFGLSYGLRDDTFLKGVNSGVLLG